jgi:hypothetical protein
MRQKHRNAKIERPIIKSTINAAYIDTPAAIKIWCSPDRGSWRADATQQATTSRLSASYASASVSRPTVCEAVIALDMQSLINARLGSGTCFASTPWRK